MIKKFTGDQTYHTNGEGFMRFIGLLAQQQLGSYRGAFYFEFE